MTTILFVGILFLYITNGEVSSIPNYWVGIDSRGFIFASALSMSSGGGLVMCRKKGNDIDKPRNLAKSVTVE